MSHQTRLLYRLFVAFGLCLLAVVVFCCICVRRTEYQSWAQAIVGGLADVSGANTLYMGITCRDLGTQYHQGLSDAQQRPLVVVGGVWFLAILLYLGVAFWVGVTAFRERYYPEEEEEIRPNARKRKRAKEVSQSAKKQKPIEEMRPTLKTPKPAEEIRPSRKKPKLEE